LDKFGSKINRTHKELEISETSDFPISQNVRLLGCVCKT